MSEVYTIRGHHAHFLKAWVHGAQKAIFDCAYTDKGGGFARSENKLYRKMFSRPDLSSPHFFDNFF